jgi:hypothetical protein
MVVAEPQELAAQLVPAEEYKMAVNNKWHYQPVIRQMENARIDAGLLQALATVGYTERVAAEGVTVPTPTNYPAVGAAAFYFGGQKITPTN